MGFRAWFIRRFHPRLTRPVEMEGFRQGSKTPDEPLGKQDRIRVGRYGESVAAVYLKGCGYRVLRRNHKAARGGEVDLVCREKDTLVFVEVKTRTSLKFGRPAEAVTPSKQKLVARGGLDWLRLLNSPEVAARFDVVEVLLEDGSPPEVSLIRDAFELPEPYV